MEHLLVTGGRRLSGSVRISGAKNSALKMMAASLLTPGRTTIEDVPRIQDCLIMGEVLERLGAEVVWDGRTVTVDATELTSVEAPYDLVRRMRASIIVLGPLLSRFGEATVALPGGDNIGSRSIDLHVRGLQKMGAVIRHEHGFLYAETKGLRGAPITLDYPSVGATENLLMAAASAKGTTVIDNAAREPEIADLADLLNSMGARISGAGTTTIEVDGVDPLVPACHKVIADRVEAGTYAIATCATMGDVVLKGARPEHMEIALEKLSEAGASIYIAEEGLRVSQPGRPRAVDFVTLPFPGFATDLQPIMMAMLSAAEGTSIATENVFESRFLFVDELRRMGADIRTEGHHAVIRGVPQLSGAPVRAPDIRAGAAMVVAGLSADGVTEISGLHHIDRGYEDLEQKLEGLGAEVRREGVLDPVL